MADASAAARVADLLGYDPERDDRLPLDEASRSVRPGQVVAARGPSGAALAVYATDDGRIFAVEDTCPHDGGPLSSGFVDGRRLVCARHGWEFDVETGTCARAQGGICPRRVAQVCES